MVVTGQQHVSTVEQNARIDIAVLIEAEPIKQLVCDLVQYLGWDWELIDANTLERATEMDWKLVVIGADGPPPSTALLAAKASRNPLTRVLVLAPSREPQQIADILRSGADDYLAIPFDPAECSIRMQALVGRTSLAIERRRHQLAFDFATHTISSGPISVTLSPREWDVLMALLEAEGASVPIETLEQHVWGSQGHEAAVVSTVSRIRQRLVDNDFPAIVVKTERGGYSATFRRTADTLPRLDGMRVTT
jgi:DNA-binding response OmpR family regulator